MTGVLHSFPPGKVFGFKGAMLAVWRWPQRYWYGGFGDRARRRATTPDACWHGGSVYYNSQDAALLVEKRIGVGWTF
jgi:hypothetical protein